MQSKSERMEVQKKRERRQDLFLTQYQEYRTKFISHAVFDDLDESDKQTFSDFGKTAHKVFHEIIKARKLGEEYRVAALSFFASGDVLDHAGWSYLILRTSYFVEALYIKLAVIPDSQAKQKETFDLFRYIAKSILQQSEESSLKDESKRLLEYFIEYMLELEQDKVTSDWESFLKNKIKQNLPEFTQTKVLNYINDLKIIFKRLKQGRIVKRSRRKKIKISDWPTKKKLRSFQKKREQRQLIKGYPAYIQARQEIFYADDGDVEFIDEGIAVHTTSKSTARFNTVLNNHSEHLMRHRQRRLQPFVTNTNYMSKDVIQHLIYILKGELYNAPTQDSAIAAACLLSLATGLSPMHLLQYKQLIDEGVLIKGGSSKKAEYRLRLHLDITKQKVETLKIHQLNQTVTHDLHVSSSWFEYLILNESQQLLTVQEINQRLKKWTQNQGLGSITVEKLQAQLYFYIFHRTFNEYIAHVLSGKDSTHELPSSFYNGVSASELNQHYLIYLETLSVEETKTEIEMLKEQFVKHEPASISRFGSQLALNQNYVGQFFTRLHAICVDKIQIHQHIIERINAYSAWMWHISLLCLTRRPRENLLGKYSDYDLKLKLLYVDDKQNSRSRKDGRYIPLPAFFIQAFKRYTQFLNTVTQQYEELLRFVFGKKITLQDLFGQVIHYPKSLPTTAEEWASKKIKIAALNRSWINDYIEGHQLSSLYNNWLRHFDMNMLMEQGLAFNVIQAVYGHDQRNQELFYRYSSASLPQYINQFTQNIDRMIKQLQIEHLSYISVLQSEGLS